MGRLEKIVVITVLFLVAVILGISLNGGGEEEALEVAARNRRKAAADVAEAGVEKSEAGGVMSASVKLDAPAAPVAGNVGQDLSKVAQPAPAVVTPAPIAAQPVASSFLVTTVGLEPTSSDEVMVYTWKAGDSFKALAQTYYGSPLHVARLRAANEGQDEAKLTAGTRIQVPAKSASGDVRVAAAPAAAGAAAPSAAWANGMYTVKSGDVLGSISKTVYGTTKHWKRIHDANRDVIGDDPNRLKVGMQLRIPEVK